MISTAIAKTIHSEWMDVGNKIDNPLHGRSYQEDDILFLRQINSEIAYNKNDIQLIENKIEDVDIEDQAHYYAISGALNGIETLKQ